MGHFVVGAGAAGSGKGDVVAGNGDGGKAAGALKILSDDAVDETGDPIDASVTEGADPDASASTAGSDAGANVSPESLDSTDEPPAD